MADSVRRMGRPPLADRETLRERAVRVLIERGYSAVTMSEIACEVGVSVRTLHRYFPAKADIVWSGVDDTFDVIRESLAGAATDQPIADAIADAVEAAFTAGEAGLAVSRERIRLIAVTPELQAVRSESFGLWRTELIHFIAHRLDQPVGGVVATAAATALQSAMMAALAWWATTDDPRPPDASVVTALRGIKLLGSG